MTNTIAGQHFKTRSEAQTMCDTNTDCKGVFRYLINGSDFFSMTRTAETENNDGDYDFAEKPTCATGTGGGSSGGHEYSAGSSRSDPPVDNIARSDNGDHSSGMLAGSGYGPGAMYGEGGRNSATPWFKGTDEDNYIAKSALVPCTCTTHSMGCAKHSGGRDQSKSPGDMDGSPNQYGIMKPFSSAFSNQEEPSGFLNTFNAFMR